MKTIQQRVQLQPTRAIDVRPYPTRFRTLFKQHDIESMRNSVRRTAHARQPRTDDGDAAPRCAFLKDVWGREGRGEDGYDEGLDEDVEGVEEEFESIEGVEEGDWIPGGRSLREFVGGRHL